MTDENAKPFRLFLLRHARAGWAKPGETDINRSLDDNGRTDAAKIGNLAAANFDLPSQVLCSAALRCRQTLDVFLSCQNTTADILYSNTLFTGHVDDYLTEIMRYSGNPALLLVGHNPSIEYLMTVLLGEEQAKAAIPNGYPTAGYAVIDIAHDLQVRSGRLVAMLQP